MGEKIEAASTRQRLRSQEDFWLALLELMQRIDTDNRENAKRIARIIEKFDDLVDFLEILEHGTY